MNDLTKVGRKKWSTFIAGGVALFLVPALLYAHWASRQANESAKLPKENGISAEEAKSNQEQSGVAQKPASSAPKPATVSFPKNYGEAFNAYSQSGNYFQFSECIPTGRNSLVLKKGLYFMIDNRDQVSHRFGVGNKSYNVAALGYVIVPTPATAGDYNITCDGAARVELKVAE